MRVVFAAAMLSLLSACSSVGLPKGVEPITGFETDRYLGQWYEIARLDHRFERGLQNVTATYSMRKDGGLVVENRGYSTKKNQWQNATGKAYFIGHTDIGHLKVSFFGPFYGGYAVFELDKEDYQYAFISGSDTDYLWFLSRTPTVSDEQIARFKGQATELGFDVDSLILVDQAPRN